MTRKEKEALEVRRLEEARKAKLRIDQLIAMTTTNALEEARSFAHTACQAILKARAAGMVVDITVAPAPVLGPVEPDAPVKPPTPPTSRAGFVDIPGIRPNPDFFTKPFVDFGDSYSPFEGPFAKAMREARLKEEAVRARRRGEPHSPGPQTIDEKSLRDLQEILEGLGYSRSPRKP